MAFAMFCLVLQAGCSLAMPNFQGNIIDEVIQGDKEAFYKYIQYYVLVCGATGLVAGGQAIAFRVATFKITYHVRTRLFESLAFQDCAYYDGTTSGKVLSILQNDVATAMQPIQTTLSTVLYQSLNLVGAVVACFITSYQLSMMAFIAAVPIVELWTAYAEYSRNLNRKTSNALGEASSTANQALKNIRTVKAFASEPFELEAYFKAARYAMMQGFHDAIGLAGTSLVTTYLDNGAMILILLVGGTLVLADDPSANLTVGSLITFNLYWGMLNNAYQALQGLLTSFTRAAASAEKIFSMIDLEPSVNPKAGSPVDWPVRGLIEFSDVKCVGAPLVLLLLLLLLLLCWTSTARPAPSPASPATLLDFYRYRYRSRSRDSPHLLLPGTTTACGRTAWC